jgi:signal transduction histidine kinase
MAEGASEKFTDQFLSGFFTQVEAFTNACARNNHLSNIISAGLETCLHVQGCVYASYFQLNTETFEFEHRATMPRHEQDKIQEIFNGFVESDIVGQALSSGLFIWPYRSEESGDCFYLAPMIGSAGVTGMVILRSAYGPEELTDILIRSIGYFIQMFAKTLENAEFAEAHRVMEDMRRQQIASKTIALVETQRKLQDSMEDLKTNIAMSIPHEIRTPINTILGFSHYLINHFGEVDFADATEMLKDINNAGHRLNRLFENYIMFTGLSIVAINASELQRVRQRFTESVQSLISGTASYRASLAGRVSDLHVSVAEAAVAMSEEYLKKIIEELVDNAFKYSEPGSAVIVKTRVTPTHYIIDVRDRGRGMTPEQAQNIQAYAQFQRRIYEQQGNGLGLAIVQKLCDIYNCTLSFTGAENEGTEVRVQIPLPSPSLLD